MHLTVLALVAIGLVMVYSASSYIAAINYKDSTHYLKTQLLSAVIGFAALFFMMNFDYHKIKKYLKPTVIVTIVLLIVVLFFHGKDETSRWIPLGPFNLQPSEIAKYVLVAVLAFLLEKNKGNDSGFIKGILLYALVGGFFAGLIYLGKNLSTTLIVVMVTLVLLFAAGRKMRYFIIMLALVAAVGTFGILAPGAEYRMNRITSFMNPWADASGTGYQVTQSFMAFGSGGLFGVGLGNSRQKCLYLPEPQNDFIFAIIAEEFGLLGCVILISLYFLLLYRGALAAIRAKDSFGCFLATGIITVIGLQCVINMAVVTGTMPVTGVTLPFISYGGSSLIINMASMGVLLNITRQNNKAL
ncbi:MAG: putative lipid II flippase FtsW [Oscillospiraceae bacterium]|nr:putative lipid II flippase FtsW [Oscillospiraceae bacterium]